MVSSVFGFTPCYGLRRRAAQEWGSLGARKASGRKEESSFFEKKEAKKLLRHGVRWLIEQAPHGQSFFASFCSQKEDPSCTCLSDLQTNAA
jgi:hypothetical protein